MGLSHGTSACRHRNRELLDFQYQRRGDKRNRLRQFREQKFDSDDDEEDIWEAWGGSGELTLANGQPFSSGTENEETGREFERTIQRLFSLASTKIKLQHGLDNQVTQRLRKAHRRLRRDLAMVECDYNIGPVLAQLDGVGSLSPSMTMGEWVVEPVKKEGKCIAEFCINSKPFSARVYQVGRIAEMIDAGATCTDSYEIKGPDIIYLIIVDKSRPNLEPSRIVRRYTALSRAFDNGRFGVLYVSMGTLVSAWERGSAGMSSTSVVWVRELIRKDGTLEEKRRPKKKDSVGEDEPGV